MKDMRQHMKDLKQARGSAATVTYSDPSDPETLGTVPGYVGAALGFRLVHESSYAGVANGNLWFSGTQGARSMYRQSHLPGGKAKTVGFRLAWDREGT
jgi:hypothetical protein